VPVSVERYAALAAAAAALLSARVWLRIAPGRAVRWASRIESPPRRGLRGSLTGRGSRGLHGSQSALLTTNPSMPPRGPRSVENPCDPRPAEYPRDPRSVEHALIRDLSTAVIAAGVRPPLSATCLEQSLALVILLSAARQPARLIVGVSRAESTVRAHAWVECRGDVVLGGAQAAGYAPLVGGSSSAPSAVASSCPG
jgi:Transglutaminase-like superfamily